MKQEKRDERLSQLLDAAEECFREMGFKRTSLEDVAARAGIGKATLYHYVEGKSELFGEVAHRFHVRMIAMRKELIDAQSEPVAKLRALAESFLQQHEEVVKLIAPKTNELEGHVPLKFRYIRAFREKEKELISSVLEFGIQKGAFRPLDVSKTASLVEMAVKGMVMEFWKNPDALRTGEYADLLVDVLLKGIEQR